LKELVHKKSYANGKDIIKEIIDDYSYEIIIERKDGENIKNSRINFLRRKYTISHYNFKEVLLLEQLGKANGLLIRIGEKNN